ncbi:hypothetical protein ACLKA7_011686 [Drosophila subpalustris]
MLITVAEGAKVREDLLLRPAFSTAPAAVFKSAAGGADASSDEDGDRDPNLGLPFRLPTTYHLRQATTCSGAGKLDIHSRWTF